MVMIYSFFLLTCALHFFFFYRAYMIYIVKNKQFALKKTAVPVCSTELRCSRWLRSGLQGPLPLPVLPGVCPHPPPHSSCGRAGVGGYRVHSLDLEVGILCM